jgi:hypothetical protein
MRILGEKTMVLMVTMAIMSLLLLMLLLLLLWQLLSQKLITTPTPAAGTRALSPSSSSSSLSR